ncbi:MAG: hypothetical protein JNM28_00380 [Armatimonadetes bacterium]|nr:hypothetical protein [Armatimonadota bacterium]
MVVPLVLTGLIAKDAYASALSERLTPLRNRDSLTGTEKAAIRKAIGKRRVVMLGELTHGDGTAFRFKVALVNFLRKEMGFDGILFLGLMEPRIQLSNP